MKRNMNNSRYKFSKVKNKKKQMLDRFIMLTKAIFVY